MAVLRRWECTEHGPDHIAWDARRAVHRCAAGNPPCLREAVEVEYVPAEQLRGAVEALREIAWDGGNGAGLTVSAPERAEQALAALGITRARGR